MIPNDVEMIIMTKKDYDRNVEQLLLDKLNLEDKIDKVIEYIKENYTNGDGTCWHEGFKPILSILGDEENESR